MSRLLPARRVLNGSRGQTERCCPGHRAWVRSHQCSVPGCEEKIIECAHVRRGTDGGMSLKPSDRWCTSHHAEQHLIGEAEFERRYQINLVDLAQAFARLSPHRDRFGVGRPFPRIRAGKGA